MMCQNLKEDIYSNKEIKNFIFLLFEICHESFKTMSLKLKFHFIIFTVQT